MVVVKNVVLDIPMAQLSSARVLKKSLIMVSLAVKNIVCFFDGAILSTISRKAKMFLLFFQGNHLFIIIYTSELVKS
ncbi:hypothetical protein SAMN00777080_0442 [Aquiflexum balticum DSM 16537]|uniref:Uncharacterized protein n=1 Tax=Aquiflexum balticum DSM 16537 TaxID=758820 RepID=A0A1W2GZV6_9BACT|nr:hypothetical protein SAMN00777080_0442 [Aquiflexum balticum DSM 16537]